MIEVIQAPEIGVTQNTIISDAIRLTLVKDGVTTVQELVYVGEPDGVQYLYFDSEENANYINFSGGNYQLSFYIDTVCYSTESPTLEGSWTISGFDSVTTELVQIAVECVKVNDYVLPCVGTLNGKKNFWKCYDSTIQLFFDTTDNWLIPLTTSLYTLTSTENPPLSDAWVYDSGDDIGTVTTSLPSFTSKWQAVNHPIKWELQRMDAMVDDKSIDGDGRVSLYLTELPPTVLQVGNLATYHLPNGDTIGSVPITAISGHRIQLLSLIPGSVMGGFVIFDDLYKNYYVETSILADGTTEIGTTRTIPNALGVAKVDVHRFLKTQSDFTENRSGKYKIKFRECYNFTKQSYGALTDFYYWSNSAKQIGDLYGSNMAMYVGNLEIECKFLSVFNRPTHFIGYPFTLSYIVSGDWTKQLRRVQNGSVNTLISHTSGAINTLEIGDTTTSVQLEFGTIVGLPIVFTKEGNLTEEKQIKINTKCLQNAVCLRWVNTLGGFEYWVFSYNQIHSLETGIVSTFQPYINDLETAESNIFDIERFETNRITLGATVDIEDIKGLKTLLSSIDVKLQTDIGWVNVRPETGSFKIYETRNTTADIELTLSLPFTNIQTR